MQTVTTFQYISCCYSSMQQRSCMIMQLNFNTSHVVIHPRLTISSVGGIGFQYISCCYSSRKSGIVLVRFHHFNTSHVVIHRQRTHQNTAENTYFNTSHVVIHLSGLSGSRKLPLFQYISCCYSSG